MLRGLLTLFTIWALGCFVILSCGCCWTAKRSCFPPCPAQLPAKVVKIEVPCELPPQIKVPTIKRMVEGCPEKWVCYDIPNAAKLAKRNAMMRGWILEARRRCTPTSRP